MLSISIIVPVYNVSKYISRCIHSIIEQEECGAFIECIIINDCSPDNSMEIIHSLIDNYYGTISFVIISHNKNRGLSAARNSGIDIAHGDYLFFLDSDDWLPSGSISKFVTAIEENPYIDMVIGNYLCKKEEASIINNVCELTLINNWQLKKNMLNYQDITYNAWNKMICSSFFSNKKNRFPEGIIFEDIYWSFLLFKEIKQSIILPDITYIYEDNDQSITNTCQMEQNFSLYLKSINRIIFVMTDNPYYDLYPDCFIFLLQILITNILFCHNHHINNDDSMAFFQLRKKVVRRLVSDRHYFLAYYIRTLIFPPFSLLFRIGWVRRHYYIIEKIGRVIANSLEKIHL